MERAVEPRRKKSLLKKKDSLLTLILVLLFSAFILESTIGMSLNGIGTQRASEGKQRILAYGGTIDSYEPDLRNGNNLGVVTNSIIINGTQTYVIANGTYTLNETIIVVEFARLIVENATVTFNTTDYIVITSYDNAIVEITNSEINHAQGAQLHSRFFSAVSVTNSTVDILISYEDANASITKSTFDIVHGYGSSVVSIIDTEIRFVGAHDTSSVSVVNSTVDAVYCASAEISIDNSTVKSLVDVYGSSTVSISDSIVNQVSVYGSSVVTVAHSNSDIICATGSTTVYAFNSTVRWFSARNASVINSTISEIQLYFYGDSNVSLFSLPVGFIGYWDLYENNTITKAYFNLTIKNTTVSAWDIKGYGSPVVSVANSVISDGIAYFSSLISLFDSEVLNNVTAHSSSIVLLVNSPVHGSINILDFPEVNAQVYVAWYLDMLVIDAKRYPLPNAHVKVYLENGTLLTGTTTDDEGVARFILYEKIVNATGTFPYGNYTVKATYDGYTCQRVIKSITKNMKITVIPWICIYHHGLIYGIYTEWVVVILPGSRPIRISIR